MEISGLTEEELQEVRNWLDHDSSKALWLERKQWIFRSDTFELQNGYEQGTLFFPPEKLFFSRKYTIDTGKNTATPYTIHSKTGEVIQGRELEIMF